MPFTNEIEGLHKIINNLKIQNRKEERKIQLKLVKAGSHRIQLKKTCFFYQVTNKLSVTLFHQKSRLPSAWCIASCSSEDDEFEIDFNEYEEVLMENVLQPVVGGSVACSGAACSEGQAEVIFH